MKLKDVISTGRLHKAGFTHYRTAKSETPDGVIVCAEANSSPADAQYDVAPLLQANSAVAGFQRTNLRDEVGNRGEPFRDSGLERWYRIP